MSVRCKLRCVSKNTYKVQNSDGSEGVGATLSFKAVHGATVDADGKFVSFQQSCEENKIFGHWTPSADFSMSIHNETAHAQFEVGGEYYFDITPSPTKEHYN